jgi:DDE superfamily endonuclease/Helix-turn-helix of DDE superfamily endonuclease
MRPPTWVRAALSHPCFTGISQQHLGDLIAELADPWTAQHQAAPGRRRGHPRRRAAGAGPTHRLAGRDRVLVTLVVLRLQLPHQALATLFGVDRATVTRAARSWPPAAGRPRVCRPRPAGVRLRTLADVFAYAQASGVELRLDGTQTQVRRPRAHRMGQRAFVSGKRKQNTSKPTVCSDAPGRTLWAGAVRPGRMHDQTAVKTEGIADLLAQHPTVKVRVDEGYRDWPPRSPSSPPPRPGRGGGRLAAGPHPAVLNTDLRGTCDRRAQAVAHPAALSRPPGVLRRDLPGGRRPGLGPGSPTLIKASRAVQANAPRS